ncbi:HWE histidine kinase domain-containing protein [Bauldia litoralis]|uniref:HWE histidine kinase domain-containing protein n=1 Tax=Bauldia litoralis TaxID=665467 RepID=UPI003265D712
MATAVAIVVGLGATALGGWFVYDSYQRLREEQASARIDTAATAVKVALDRVAISVRAVRGLYAANNVTKDEFDRFAVPLAADEVLRGIGFLRRVPAEDRQEYQVRFETEPARSIGIWQRGPDGAPVAALERPFHFVIESGYLSGDGQPSYGFDAASDPVRRAAIEQTISQFQLVVSDATSLLVTDERGVVFYLPALDRSGDVIGVAFASVTVNDLARFAQRTSGIAKILLTVGPSASAAEAVADAEPVTSPPNRQTFSFGGRTWTVTVGAAPSSASTVMWWAVLLVVGAGLASTVAVVGYIANRSKTEQIAEAQAQLRGMLDGIGPLAWLLGPDGKVISANRAAVEVMKVAEGDMIGRALWDLSLDYEEPEEGARIRQAIATARNGEDARFDFTIDVDEESRVLDLWVRPLTPKSARTHNLVATAVDVTDRHEAQEIQRLLMRELDHRMKNTLQVIQAVIRRTARTQQSVSLFENSLLGRIQTMSRAHELLAGERWLGADIDTVIRQEAGSFDVGGVIRIGGPRLRLSPKAALSFALVIHELGTNASKYGALSIPTGRVEIVWSITRIDEELWMLLKWQESGGPAVKPPEDRGFGSMLIERSIAYELGGDAHLDFREEGLLCEIRAPLHTIRPFAKELSKEKVNA